MGRDVELRVPPLNRKECKKMTRTNHIRAIALVATVALAAGVLALVEPALGAFPGTNGKIVFESSRLGQTNIFAMDPSPGAQATLLTSVNDNGPKEEPVVSPDGSKIAFSRDFDLFSMNADGTGKTNITNTASAQEYQAAWSPDGKEIAFDNSRSGNDEIWRMRAIDGNNPVSLTNNPASDFSPSWQPIP